MYVCVCVCVFLCVCTCARAHMHVHALLCEAVGASEGRLIHLSILLEVDTGVPRDRLPAAMDDRVGLRKRAMRGVGGGGGGGWTEDDLVVVVVVYVNAA